MKISNRSNSGAYASFGSPQQQEFNKKNAAYMRALQLPFKARFPNDKQFNWAKDIFESTKEYLHSWGFRQEEIEIFMKTPQARSASWWISNRPKQWGDGIIVLAIRKVLEASKKS